MARNSYQRKQAEESEKVAAQIRDLMRYGFTYKEVGAEYGLKKSTVYKLLHFKYPSETEPIPVKPQPEPKPKPVPRAPKAPKRAPTYTSRPKSTVKPKPQLRDLRGLGVSEYFDLAKEQIESMKSGFTFPGEAYLFNRAHQKMSIRNLSYVLQLEDELGTYGYSLKNFNNSVSAAISAIVSWELQAMADPSMRRVQRSLIGQMKKAPQRTLLIER